MYKFQIFLQDRKNMMNLVFAAQFSVPEGERFEAYFYPVADKIKENGVPEDKMLLVCTSESKHFIHGKADTKFD